MRLDWCWGMMAALLVGLGAAPGGQEIPVDLLEDRHFQEEFGINEVTVPSIRKIFEQLEGLGRTSWEKYGRETPAEQPAERARLALSLGGMIAEGFFITQTESTEKLEAVGNAIVRRATALGTGTRLGTHGKALMEFSERGDWNGLREELAKAQQSVQIELIRLRDVEAVHLISLGGWLRALEVICAAALEPYAADKAELLRRVDVVTYFAEELETLHPRLQQEDYIIGLRRGLEELRGLMEQTGEKTVSEEHLEEIREVVGEMAKWAFEE